MRKRPVLAELEAVRAERGAGLGARKLGLLRQLESTELAEPAAVLRLHETLCFLRAYPDDAAVRRQVDRMLAAFAVRADLLAHAAALADSGIAGTAIHFRFYAATAAWLAERWPAALELDWPELGRSHRLEKLLPLLATFSESPALDEWVLTVRQWIDRLRGRDPAGTFVVKRLAAQRLSMAVHEAVSDDLDLPFVLRPGVDTPARTREVAAGAPVVHRPGPLQRQRPDLRAALAEPPQAVRAVSLRQGQALVDLARSAMVTRARDLDAFAYGDPRDVRLIDCGAGLQFAAIGVVPERRLMFEAVYGFLTLQSGVAIGYVLNSALFGSAEIAYNVFESFRGGEAAWVYARFLAAIRHLFAADTFTVFPYQLGENNDEALRSGAWWFYQKLGFRPRDPAVLRLMERELAAMRARPDHRSSIATLRRLAAANLYFELGAPREDVIGELSTGNIGMRVVELLAGRFGADRERGLDVCAVEAASRLGLASPPAATDGERLAWRRWAPLVCILPGVDAWTPAQRRALAAVIRAKGGRRESDFVRRFDRHRPLREALLRLAAAAR